MIKGDLFDDINISLSDKVQRGIDFLKSCDFNNMSDGKHLIDGANLYVNIQTYNTKSDADFEAHRRYIDIQYIIKGEEVIGVTDYKNCVTKIQYDDEKDIEFLTGVGNMIKLSQGQFMILNPEDAHKPSVSVDADNPVIVRKAVVKVLL